MAGSASAATINVDTKKDEFGAAGTKRCSLREAIRAANADSKFGGCSKGNGSDTVHLGKGTYKLSIETDGSVEDNDVEGDLDTKSNITLAGRGEKQTAIDGNSQKLDERIINQKSANLTIKDLTLRNGHSVDDDDDRGGAVWNEGANKLTMDHVRVFSNYTFYSGGGIAVTDGGTLKLTNSDVEENAADDYGSGITSYDDGGKVLIRNTKIVGNVAENGAAIIVGGGRLTLDHSKILNNTGYDYGGGMDLYGNGATIRFSTISGNRALEGAGGAIYDESNDGPVVITNSTFSDNYASTYGGGIYAANTENWTIRNSTFSRNTAVNNDINNGLGGAIANLGATMALENVTMTKNTAYDVSGIYATGGTTTLRNSIVAGNRDYGDDLSIEDCYNFTGLSSLGHNVFGDDTCTPVGSDRHGDSTDPLWPGLRPLAGNGGPTQTNALVSGSPAINHGKNCPSRDQRGHKRKGKCDSGAFER